MVIEWQRVRVPPDLRQRFVELDAEIWTAGLAREAGFLGKEVWLDEESDEIVLVIRWRSREDWKGIPSERLKELERRFWSALPDYEVVEVRALTPLRGGDPAHAQGAE